MIARIRWGNVARLVALVAAGLLVAIGPHSCGAPPPKGIDRQAPRGSLPPVATPSGPSGPDGSEALQRVARDPVATRRRPKRARHRHHRRHRDTAAPSLVRPSTPSTPLRVLPAARRAIPPRARHWRPRSSAPPPEFL